MVGTTTALDAVATTTVKAVVAVTAVQAGVNRATEPDVAKAKSRKVRAEAAAAPVADVATTEASVARAKNRKVRAEATAAPDVAAVAVGVDLKGVKLRAKVKRGIRL